MTPSTDTHLIDRVASAMTTMATQPDLRERVLARLETRRPARRWMYFSIPAIAAAAAAVLVVGRGAPDSSVADTPAPTAIAALPTPTDTAAVKSDTLEVVSRPKRSRTSATLVMTPARAAWLERAIPALTPIAPIEVGGIQPHAIDIAQLEVKPLTTPPIDGGTRQNEKER
jgi:hypothetical protein